MKEELTPPATEPPAAPWTSFLAALQFLSISPALIRRPFTAREIGRAVAYFPLVGASLGLLLAGANALLALILPPPARSAILLTLWVVLTGALHLDGFLDTCDGLLGGWTPDKRLEIMRDERVGAYALAGGILLLLLKFSALLSLNQPWRVLIMAPTLSRWGMSLAIVGFPYARPAGLGRTMKDQAGWLDAGISTLLALLITWFAGHWTGIGVSAMVVFIVWLGAQFALHRIPGLTGDVYGALNEIVELFILLAWLLWENWS